MGINTHLLKSYLKHFFTAKRKGHDVHSPFAYSLCEEVFYNNASFYNFQQLNRIRQQLLRNKTMLEIEDLGAGSKSLKGNRRMICDIAAKGMSSRKQNEILYKLINYLRPKTIIELGTSLGLNALYLSLANTSAKTYTLEGSAKLSSFSERLASNNNVANIRFINGNFDITFPKLLTELETVDLIYVDGNHTYKNTLAYFRMALEKKTENSVFIFDDIYWSEGMTKAWKEIISHPEVHMSIDAFWFGFIFFKKEIKEPVHLKFLV
jgi:predicted O-methyltransferase YrrM